MTEAIDFLRHMTPELARENRLGDIRDHLMEMSKDVKRYDLRQGYWSAEAHFNPHGQWMKVSDVMNLLSTLVRTFESEGYIAHE